MKTLRLRVLPPCAAALMFARGVLAALDPAETSVQRVGGSVQLTFTLSRQGVSLLLVR